MSSNWRKMVETAQERSHRECDENLAHAAAHPEQYALDRSYEATSRFSIVDALIGRSHDIWRGWTVTGNLHGEFIRVVCKGAGIVCDIAPEQWAQLIDRKTIEIEE